MGEIKKSNSKFNEKIQLISEYIGYYSNKAQLKYDILMNENKIGSYFKEIGKSYYENKNQGLSLTEKADSICEKIDELKKSTEELRIKADSPIAIGKCSICNKKVPSGFILCFDCNAKEAASINNLKSLPEGEEITRI